MDLARCKKKGTFCQEKLVDCKTHQNRFTQGSSYNLDNSQSDHSSSFVFILFAITTLAIKRYFKQRTLFMKPHAKY